MAHLDAFPLSQLFTTFETKNTPLVDMAQQLRADIRSLIDGNATVDEYLADPLLLPMALAGGGSLITTALSLHTTTNIKTISRFLPVSFNLQCRLDQTIKVTV